MATTMTLLQLRDAVRQRSDMVNSTFVSDAELNSYINQSAFEFYDLLITVYENYFMAPPIQFQTDGSMQFALPDGVLYSAAPKFYKLMGVDLGLAQNNNAWLTLKRFDFIERNKYIYPQLTSNYLGVFNLRYEVVGGNLMFIPTPSAGQYIRVWYIPVFQTLTSDSDTLDGISGWTEYVICDGSIKCGQKEETDVSVLMAQKQALLKRIEEAASNRDIALPARVSDTRGSYGFGWGEGGLGPSGGF